MTVEFRYAGFDDYQCVSRFLDEYWAKDHVYVRVPKLFDWTFRRETLWDHCGYSFAIAEDKGEIVGILGGIPFVFNHLGRSSYAVWLANYMVRPDYRRGPTAMRLLGMFCRAPFERTIAFGVTADAAEFYRRLRWEILEKIPRHFVVMPNALERMAYLLRLSYPAWPSDRADALARFFALRGFLDSPTGGATILPLGWDYDDWPSLALRTIGAARDLSYLKWRYCQHPCFRYRFIAMPEGDRTGLAVWRLETIRVATDDGLIEFDRIGRLVEFLPASRDNAKLLLGLFWQELYDADALGADYYGYHCEFGGWLEEAGFPIVGSKPDGWAIPSRFQPLDGRGGNIVSTFTFGREYPGRTERPQPMWYWTKSDADQDRPN
jgi:hypothetical protein